MGAAAPMAPPKRENKEEMNEWVSDDQRRESAVWLGGSFFSMNANEWKEMERKSIKQAAHQGRIARGKAKRSQSIHFVFQIELLVELR